MRASGPRAGRDEIKASSAELVVELTTDEIVEELKGQIVLRRAAEQQIDTLWKLANKDYQERATMAAQSKQILQKYKLLKTQHPKKTVEVTQPFIRIEDEDDED